MPLLSLPPFLILLSLVLGLKDHVAFFKNKPEATEFRIGGFDRLSPEIELYIAVAACAATASPRKRTRICRLRWSRTASPSASG